MSNDSLKGPGYFYLYLTNSMASINKKQKLIKTTKRKASLDCNMPVKQNQDRTLEQRPLKGLTNTRGLSQIYKILFYIRNYFLCLELQV